MTALDQVAQQLRQWRIAAGSPSFSELARRVGEERARDPQEGRRLAPGKVTVYDCFRDGRTRIDVNLAVDLARVLGVTGAELTAWRVRCAEAMRPPAEHGLVTASTVLPAPVEPGVDTGLEDLAVRRVLLAGMGGTGKTQAAIRLLNRWREARELDQVLTIRVDGHQARGAAVVHAVAHELGVRLPPQPGPAAARLMAHLARRRCALLIDDLAAADQLLPLLRVPSEVPVVATSRLALVVPGLERIDLTPWDTQAVTAYLAEVVGTHRTAAEPEATRRVAELTQGLPLVAALVAARIHATPSWSLADHAAALSERQAGDRVEDAVRVSLDATVSGLSPRARELLRTLASGPRPGVSSRTLDAVGGGDLAAAVAELEAAYLLGKDDARHRLHDIARAYARGRASDEEPPSVRVARQDRILDQLCAEAWGVSEDLSLGDAQARRFDRPAAAVPDPQAWLSSDLPAALELASEAQGRRPTAIVELAEAVSTTAERAGLSSLSEQLHTGAREAAMLLDDPVGEVRARTVLAITSARRAGGDPPLAELTALAERAGDPLTQARLGNLRGILAMRASREEEGLAEFRAAHQLALDAGLHALIPVMADNLALTFAGAGDLEESLRWAEYAVTAASRSGRRGLVGSTLASLSRTQLLLGRHDDAVASARSAVVEAEEAADLFALAQALLICGRALTGAGHPDAAVQQFRRAEAIAADIGLDELEGRLHLAIGEASLTLGDRTSAAQRFREALAGPHDSPEDPATALHQLGLLARDSDPERADELFTQALEVLGDGFEQIAARIRRDRALLSLAAGS